MEALFADSSTAYLAARLALLALRASIGKDVPLDADRVVIAPASAAITKDAAARQLALLPKPVFCGATAGSGTMVIRCEPLAERPGHEQEWYRVVREDDPERGGFMGYLLANAAEPRDVRVLASGRDETMVIPLPVAEEWHRDYEIADVNMTGDEVTNPWKVADSVYQDAQQRGAKGLLIFSSPADDEGAIAVTTVELESDAVAPADRMRTEEQLVEMARQLRRSLDALPPDTASTDTLQAWAAWSARALQRHREFLKQVAASMERHFAGAPLPPEVAAFIEECRKRC